MKYIKFSDAWNRSNNQAHHIYNGCVDMVCVFRRSIFKLCYQTPENKYFHKFYEIAAYWNGETSSEVERKRDKFYRHIADWVYTLEFKHEFTLLTTGPVFRFRKGPPAHPNKSTNIEKT